jgi:hypothetical protein
MDEHGVFTWEKVHRYPRGGIEPGCVGQEDVITITTLGYYEDQLR